MCGKAAWLQVHMPWGFRAVSSCGRELGRFTCDSRRSTEQLNAARALWEQPLHSVSESKERPTPVRFRVQPEARNSRCQTTRPSIRGSEATFPCDPERGAMATCLIASQTHAAQQANEPGAQTEGCHFLQVQASAWQSIWQPATEHVAMEGNYARGCIWRLSKGHSGRSDRAYSRKSLIVQRGRANGRTGLQVHATRTLPVLQLCAGFDAPGNR